MSEVPASAPTAGSPLKKLILESAKESAKEVEDTLINGIAIGQGTSHIGWVMSQVSNLPYDRAYRITRTEIARAYRSASHEQYKKSGIIVGYRRMCYKPTACFACLMMDGEFYPIGQGALQDHPNGKCTPIPVREGHENDTPRWQTGREWFDGLSEDDQRKLMGNGRFELWKEQSISPRRMVFMKDNKVWGASPAIKTVESLKSQSTAAGAQTAYNNIDNATIRAEMFRRWQTSDGREIVDKPTFNKLTKSFIKSGGIIIRGEEAANHLNGLGASASYMNGAKAAYIRDDATVSDVIEEMFHWKQDVKNSFGLINSGKTNILREIEAKEHLISVADKYKIPEEERKQTLSELAYYRKKLKNWHED